MTILAKVTLPYPPTVNHYWMIGRRKVTTKNGSRKSIPCIILTERGREYRDQVAIAVYQQCGGKPRIRGTLRVTIGANPPDRASRDLDNLNKAILDSLQHADLYVDDGQIDDLRVIRLPVVDGGRVCVVVEAVESLPLFERTIEPDAFNDQFLRLFEQPDGVATGAEPKF